MIAEESVWVLVVGKKGKLTRNSEESLSEGVRWGKCRNKDVIAIVFESEDSQVADAILNFDVDQIVCLGNHNLKLSVERCSEILMQLIHKHNPWLFLFDNTGWSSDVAGFVSAKLQLGIVTNCIRISADSSGDLEFVRSVYGGKLAALARINTSGTKLASLCLGYFLVEKSRERKKVDVRKVDFEVPNRQDSVVVQESIKINPRALDLEEAEIIVAGGRGIGSRQAFEKIRELANMLGAATGASRVAVDKEWVDSRCQIGQTGTSVYPAVFIAFGISGALQFTMGMKDSQLIIANDINRSAPILKMADVVVIGDLHKIVPALIQELKESAKRI